MGMNPEQPPEYGQYGQYGTPQPPQNETPQPHPWATPPPPPPPYTAPPNYGAPYPQSQPAPPPNRWGPSSLGMDANLAAGLSYLAEIVIGPILAIVFFFVEKSNRFVKFHSAQVILLSIAAAVVFIVLAVINGVLIGGAAATANNSTAASTGFGVGVVFTFCLFPLAGLGFFALWLWGMIAAFSGKYTKLPVIGNIAESWAGGPAMPMY